MKRVAITILLSCLLGIASLTAQEPDLQHYAMVDGRKYIVDGLEKTVMIKDDKNYVKFDGKFYPLQYKRQTPTSPYLEFFAIMENGKKYYPSRVYQARIKRAMGMEDEAERILRNGSLNYYVQPDTKPFITRIRERTYKRTHKRYALLFTPDRRQISPEELKSYGGLYKFIKRISGGANAMDTIILESPLAIDLKRIEIPKKGN